jgi:hypothetical protein
MGFLIDAVAACWMLASDMLLHNQIDYLAEIKLSATPKALLCSIVVGGVDSQV